MLDRLPIDVRRAVCAFATTYDWRTQRFEPVVRTAQRLASTCRAVRAACDDGAQWRRRARECLDGAVARAIDDCRRADTYYALRCGVTLGVSPSYVIVYKIGDIETFWNDVKRALDDCATTVRAFAIGADAIGLRLPHTTTWWQERVIGAILHVLAAYGEANVVPRVDYVARHLRRGRATRAYVCATFCAFAV